MREKPIDYGVEMDGGCNKRLSVRGLCSLPEGHKGEHMGIDCTDNTIVKWRNDDIGERDA